ncbi:hypothetical protein ACLOJK_033542 [Asimina triloba]
MAHITGLDPIVDHHSSSPKHFLPRSIRPSIPAEAICSIDGSSMLPPIPIRSIISSSTLVDEFAARTPFACIASHDKFVARYHRPLPPAATTSPPFPARRQGWRQRGTITAAPRRRTTFALMMAHSLR